MRTIILAGNCCKLHVFPVKLELLRSGFSEVLMGGVDCKLVSSLLSRNQSIPISILAKATASVGWLA